MSARLRIAACAVTLLAASCDGCSDAPPASGDAGAEPPAASCIVDNDCAAGQVCESGACAAPGAGDGGALPIADEDGGASPDEDAGAPLGAGALSVLPGELVEFGAQRLGEPVERTITITNVGEVDVTIHQLVLDENDEAAFTADPVGAVGEVLAPQASLAVVVTVVPQDGVPDQARLLILHSGTGNLLAVDLFAEFKGVSTLSATAAPGDLEPTIAELDLGAVPVGSARAATVFVRNIGAADSILGLSNVTLTPSTTGFTVAPPSLDDVVFLSPFEALCPGGFAECPGTASACTGAVCVDGEGVPLGAFGVRVTFAATAVGPKEATLTIVSDEAAVPNTQTSIVLKADGVAGTIVVEPNPIELGTVFTARDATMPFSIANVGGAPTIIEGFAVSGTTPPFAVEHTLTLPYELGPEERVDALVRFNSVNAGDHARTLTIQTDAAEDPTAELHAIARAPGHAVLLDDQVVPYEADPAPAIAFGDRYLGVSAEQTLHVANLGPGDLRVTRMTIEGDDAGRFTFFPGTIDAALPAVVLANIDDEDPNVRYQPRADVTVRYTPASLSGTEDTGTLVLETDDPDRPTLSVALSGRAVQPVVSVAPTIIDFGNVLGGAAQVTREVEIRNAGFGDLVVSSITPPAGLGSDRFVVVPRETLPVVLAPGPTPLILDVTFDPEDTTPQTVTSFTIHTNDVAAAGVVVTLSGGGDSCAPRANAAVDDSTGACIYSCVAGFHACGDSCVSHSSADSCGRENCTPCVTRPYTNRGCSGGTTNDIGTCTYSCQAQRYDLDGDRSVAQPTIGDGCEYLCDVTTPSAEVCDEVDNDCDGSRDEGLPIEDDEPSNTCASSTTNLGDVGDDNVARNWTGYKIYPTGDRDWFRVRAHETGSDFCAPWDDEHYTTTFKLKGIPAGHDFDLQVRADSCSGDLESSTAGGTTAEEIAIDWSGGCGEEDNKTFYVRVYPYPSTADSCEDYELEIIHKHK